MASFDNKEFRKALGTFATGITVITTIDSKNQPIGITVNSFTSVSLDPPLILWCLGNHAYAFDDFIKCENFAVHVLHEGQEAISQIFADNSNDKFAGLDWDAGESGLPVLQDFSACLQCQTEAHYAGGDHTIILGRVTSLESQDGKLPLIYHAGDYQLLIP